MTKRKSARKNTSGPALDKTVQKQTRRAEMDPAQRKERRAQLRKQQGRQS